MKRIAILLAAFVPGLVGTASWAADKLPPGVEQILPRGQIASVDHPQFVSAEEAEISADAWIFGVAIDGEARAYSLNLLNHHEVVNDTLAGRPVAAVW